MQNTESERDDEGARDEIDITGGAQAQQRPRGSDRRTDGESLFGGYQGPERRSGRDRRETA